MNREIHVRFCEKLGVKIPRFTRPIAESFFHTLKVELVHENKYKTREEAKSNIFRYIEQYYNRTRLHSAIDYKAPIDVELAI